MSDKVKWFYLALIVASIVLLALGVGRWWVPLAVMAGLFSVGILAALLGRALETDNDRLARAFRDYANALRRKP